MITWRNDDAESEAAEEAPETEDAEADAAGQAMTVRDLDAGDAAEILPRDDAGRLCF